MIIRYMYLKKLRRTWSVSRSLWLTGLWHLALTYRIMASNSISKICTWRSYLIFRTSLPFCVWHKRCSTSIPRICTKRARAPAYLFQSGVPLFYITCSTTCVEGLDPKIWIHFPLQVAHLSPTFFCDLFFKFECINDRISQNSAIPLYSVLW
jgi:hypothetical protein